MKWKHYLLLCLVLTVVVSGSLLLVPGLADNVEARLISFLSSNAR